MIIEGEAIKDNKEMVNKENKEKGNLIGELKDLSREMNH